MATSRREQCDVDASQFQSAAIPRTLPNASRERSVFLALPSTVVRTEQIAIARLPPLVLVFGCRHARCRDGYGDCPAAGDWAAHPGAVETAAGVCGGGGGA